jgi:hypothetical protein
VQKILDVDTDAVVSFPKIQPVDLELAM